MKKSITLRIPEPCHEDWAKMTATEKGKFCSVCTKEIFDFTSKTDEELVKFLTENKNACGRLKKSQLNREVKLERKSGQSFAPIAASVLLPLTLFSNNPKSENNATSGKPMVSMGIGRFNNPDNSRLQVFTQGIVRDENGNPLKNVKVISNETEAQTWTNKNGEYEIYTLDKEWLTFSKENFETQKIQLNNKSEARNIYLISDSQIQPILLGRIAVAPKKEEVIKEYSFHTKGTVTDDTGLPLPGVTVIIKGTSKGTQTDFDGNYKIETQPGDVLVFSYVGFETKEITVSNISNKFDITLNSYELMGDVVVDTGGLPNENYQPKNNNGQ
ncbi:carboxypeptidase-like regulatory domain-containing protein [Aequorivita todarodis]|uniref:carboxypeptidase-like regulatory domain-containing protein n=1 Tax=Aequorivita todarodis TaxID=2036821 RepID=UPI002350D7B5|nr:carboxypeptidase-like regulatory domain-containing protein [Aequorivita todarodis]MDC8000305.1 carboxypeptidase-like regulatory domain-containing protein [Aequorivita todarodis]